jgi:hypothetical protein
MYLKYWTKGCFFFAHLLNFDERAKMCDQRLFFVDERIL